MNMLDMEVAVSDARRNINRADNLVDQMAGLCAGRLRIGRVDSDTLVLLKRELRDYNIRSGLWKDEH